MVIGVIAAQILVLYKSVVTVLLRTQPQPDIAAKGTTNNTAKTQGAIIPGIESHHSLPLCC